MLTRLYKAFFIDNTPLLANSFYGFPAPDNKALTKREKKVEALKREMGNKYRLSVAVVKPSASS